MRVALAIVVALLGVSIGAPAMAESAQIETSAPVAAPEQPDEAQSTSAERPSRGGVHALFRDIAHDFTHLASGPNLFLAAAGGATSLAVHPFDPSLNAHLRSHREAVNDIFAPARYYGDTPEQMGISLATCVVGRLTDRPKVVQFGVELFRAQIVDGALTESLKLSVRRLRPDGSNRHSFPSGHTSVTFAAATLVERRLGWKPGLIAYAVASYVAASRLHDNVHYLSDVVFGAAVGAIAGRTVARDGGNGWTIGPTAVPGGLMIVAARTR